MPSTNRKKILFVVNHSAGANSRDWKKEITERLEGSDIDFSFFMLDGEESCKVLKEQIRKEQMETVVAVGGDGTVKLVAQQVLHTNTALGIIPGGSANGMAKELDIPNDLDEALEIILNEEAHSIDVIRINNKDICLHLSDVGLNAQLIHYFEKGNRRGMLGYASVLFKTLLNRHELNIKITADDQQVQRTAYMAVIANARMYGTGAMINPKGKLNDGLLEIVLVKQLAFWQIVKMLLRHRNFDSEKIEIMQAKKATIQLAAPAHFQVDGEYRDKTKQVNAVVEKRSLLVIKPQQ